MKRGFSILGALGIGAGLMYFFDPKLGNRRRMMVRDQANSLVNRSDRFIEKAVRDTRNRARGALAEATAILSEGDGVSDWVLEERVRANLGRLSRHPGAIEVTANHGQVTLSGPILKEEVDRVLSRVSSTRGVKDVNNRLEFHESARDLPTQQGGGELTEPASSFFRTPTARLLTGTSGLLMTIYGLARRGITGTVLGLAGMGLATQGLSNRSLKHFLGFNFDQNVVRVQKTINIDAPVEEVYKFWENAENFPRFMEYVKEIMVNGDNYHWTVTGPGGAPVEFDTFITRKEPNRLIAWKSRPNETIQSNGMVQFRTNANGGTRVTVHIGYTPPTGIAGPAVATMFGVNPMQAMDEDLMRMKSLLEKGKTTTSGKRANRTEASG